MISYLSETIDTDEASSDVFPPTISGNVSSTTKNAPTPRTISMVSSTFSDNHDIYTPPISPVLTCQHDQATQVNLVSSSSSSSLLYPSSSDVLSSQLKFRDHPTTKTWRQSKTTKTTTTTGTRTTTTICKTITITTSKTREPISGDIITTTKTTSKRVTRPRTSRSNDARIKCRNVCRRNASNQILARSKSATMTRAKQNRFEYSNRLQAEFSSTSTDDLTKTKTKDTNIKCQSRFDLDDQTDDEYYKSEYPSDYSKDYYDDYDEYLKS